MHMITQIRQCVGIRRDELRIGVAGATRIALVHHGMRDNRMAMLRQQNVTDALAAFFLPFEKVK